MRRTALLALPVVVFALAGCTEEQRPQMQTVPSKTNLGPAEPDEDKTPPTPEEKKLAMERLDKAIAAHGGPVRLQKLKRHIQLRTGTVLSGRFGEVNSEQDLRLEFPSRLKWVVKAFTTEGRQDFAISLNENSGWMKDAAGIHELAAEVIRDISDDMHYLRLVTLLPLKENEFVLRPIKGEAVYSRPTVGIRVTSKGQQPRNLYFDEKSNLLVGTVGRVRGAGVLQLHEVTFGDHKPFEDQIVLPSRIIDKRDGTRWLNCTVDYKFPKDGFDPKEFAMPTDK